MTDLIVNSLTSEEVAAWTREEQTSICNGPRVPEPHQVPSKRESVIFADPLFRLVFSRKNRDVAVASTVKFAIPGNATCGLGLETRQVLCGSESCHLEEAKTDVATGEAERHRIAPPE